jgi:hypothetical protein
MIAVNAASMSSARTSGALGLRGGAFARSGTGGGLPRDDGGLTASFEGAAARAAA